MKVDLAGDFLFKHELKLTNAPYSVYTTYEGNTKISDRDFIIPKFEDIKLNFGQFFKYLNKNSVSNGSLRTLLSNKNDGLTGNNYKAISKCNSAYFVLFDNSIYKHEKNKLWEKVSIPSSVDNIKTMLSYDKYIFINYYNKIYCTKDNGMTWENFTETLSNTVISKLTTNNNLLFGTTIDGIYYTKIGTSNWKSFNEGLINENIESIFVTNDLIYVATESARIFKNNLSNLSSIIKERVIPASFRLGQNYPNPFNPATNISYSISKTSIVILKVYDVLGNDICTLLNKIQNPGEYIVKYEPWNITSGIYYYALIVDNTKLVKKMILIK